LQGNDQRLHIRFHEDLSSLLTVAADGGKVEMDLDRRTSIKDLIESLGVPHTEVGQIILNGVESEFSAIVRGGDRIEVLAQPIPVSVTVPTILRPDPLPDVKFLVDVNVAKLGTLLRMVGIDAARPINHDDKALARQAAREGRILLSRDRNLFKRKVVVFGRLVRAENPEDQLVELTGLYDLFSHFRPFSRCMSCNGILRQVEKQAVLHRLEPLTEKYYHTFHICPNCDNLYWAGTHRERMLELLERIAQRLGVDLPPPNHVD